MQMFNKFSFSPSVISPMGESISAISGEIDHIWLPKSLFKWFWAMLILTSADLISLSVKLYSKLGKHWSDMKSYWLYKRVGGGGVERERLLASEPVGERSHATKLPCLLYCKNMFFIHQKNTIPCSILISTSQKWNKLNTTIEILSYE